MVPERYYHDWTELRAAETKDGKGAVLYTGDRRDDVGDALSVQKLRYLMGVSVLIAEVARSLELTIRIQSLLLKSIRSESPNSLSTPGTYPGGLTGFPGACLAQAAARGRRAFPTLWAEAFGGALAVPRTGVRPAHLGILERHRRVSLSWRKSGWRMTGRRRAGGRPGMGRSPVGCEFLFCRIEQH